jgi:hypothetical protein
MGDRLAAEFGPGAALVPTGTLIEWKAHGESAKAAIARKDFLHATIELERCATLCPDHSKTKDLLAQAKSRAARQFWKVLPATLLEAGFIQYGESVFVHSTTASENSDVTVQLHDPSDPGVSLSQCVVVASDSLNDPESLANLVALDMQAYPDCSGLGARLLKVVADMEYMAGSAADACAAANGARPPRGDDFEARALAKLPSADQLSQQIWGAGEGARKVNTARAPCILTYGDACLSKTSPKLKEAKGFHVNAKPLNGRGGGADTSQNALEDGRIMLNVAESLAEGHGLRHLQQTVRRIEEEKASCIAIFCTKGRHRSVSMAELILKKYYTGGTTKHLTIS